MVQSGAKDKDSQTSKEKREEFGCALGGFVQAIAWIEISLFTTVRIMTQIDHTILTNLITSWRVAATVDIIKRLLQLPGYKEEDIQEINDALAHLMHIEQFRNGLLHGLTVRPDERWKGFLGKSPEFEFGADFVTTNINIARNMQLAQTYPASVEILKEAMADLKKIRAHLYLFENKILDQKFPNREQPPNLDRYQQERQQAWLYKPPQQASRRPQHQSKSRPDRRQRKPSPASGK